MLYLEVPFSSSRFVLSQLIPVCFLLDRLSFLLLSVLFFLAARES